MFNTYAMMSESSKAAWIFSKIYLYIFIALFIYVVLSVFISLISDTYETLHVSWNCVMCWCVYGEREEGGRGRERERESERVSVRQVVLSPSQEHWRDRSKGLLQDFATGKLGRAHTHPHHHAHTHSLTSIVNEDEDYDLLRGKCMKMISFELRQFTALPHYLIIILSLSLSLFIRISRHNSNS